MRKQLLAFMAAIVITGVVAISIFVVGTNALANQNGIVASNSPSSAPAISTDPAAGATSGSASTSPQVQIAQLQALVAQYQAREQQYQAALNTDNSQLAQYQSEIQQVQQLLAFLQQSGLIQINSQGQIFITGNR